MVACFDGNILGYIMMMTRFYDNILGFDDNILGFDDNISEFDDNIGIDCFIQHEASLERGSPKSFPLRFHLGNMVMRMRMMMKIVTR